MFFVFEVEVNPGYTADQYAAAWVRASQIIQTAPGARGTRLHRMIEDDSKLLAIASWDSKADRDAAEQNRDPRVAEILMSQAEFVSIRVIGEFDDAEWIVMPS